MPTGTGGKTDDFCPCSARAGLIGSVVCVRQSEKNICAGRWRAAGPRALALAGALCCLGGAMAFLWARLNVVHVTDSAGGEARVVMASTTDPRRLAQAAGIELAQHDDTLFAASGGSLALLKVVRAYP